MIRRAIIVMAALAVAVPALAEPLTPARAFAEPAIGGHAAQGVRLSPDGRWVGYLRPAAGDPKATVLWVIAATGGAPRALLDTRKLGTVSETMTEEQMKFLERRHAASASPLDYWWDATGSRVLASFEGDLYLVAAADGAATRLTTTPETEADPQLAPDDRHVSFVRAGHLVIRSLIDGREQAVGSDAGGSITYGTAEFVAQEEMQRFTGQWWSPDGRAIAYTRVDDSKVSIVRRVAIGKDSAEIVADRFPLTGTRNAEVRLFVRRADGGTPVEVDLGPTRDIYLYNCAWSRDARTLYVQRQSRDQRRLDLLAVDPATGRSRVLLSETSKTWVDLERDFRPLANGNFLWGSTRTGWRHLYLYAANGRLIRPVTSGNWRIANVTAAAAPDFASLIAVDEAKSEAYFVASIDTPVEQQLYRISYARADTPHAVTTGHGWWTPAMAQGRPAGFVATYSDPRTPPQTGLYDLAGKRLAWLAENRLDATHPLYPYLDQRPAYEFGNIAAADGTQLQYMLVRPARFDPAKRYPVIVRVYAGPNVQLVRSEWRSLSDQLWTQAGYLLFALDGRGTANRDEAFEHANAGELGVVAGTDQIAGIRFLKGLSFVDPDRIGMSGWSFGGYTTVRVLTTPGSGLRAGAAGGVPVDFGLYDTHYTERFLGTPQVNPQGYARSNLKPRLKDLNGALLVLQGLSDDNVLLPNFTTLVDELEQQGKQFDIAVYPGQSHQIRGAPTLTHQFETTRRFFDHALAPRR